MAKMQPFWWFIPMVTCEEIKACLEGDYSNWAKKWAWDFPDGLVALEAVSITFSPAYLYINYQDADSYNRFAIISVSDASVKFLSPSGENYIADNCRLESATFFLYNSLVTGLGACFSILGKYALVKVYPGDKLEVWKDGVKVWTSPLASEAVSGASTYEPFGIRYDGKYVIAVTDNNKLVCFEGS